MCKEARDERNTILTPFDMKILVLTDSYLPHAGGSRVYYHNLYKYFKANEITVLTKEVQGCKEFDAQQGYRIIRSGKPLMSWKLSELPKGISSLFSLFKYGLLNSIDIIHAGDLYPPGVIAMLVKQARGIPFVAFSHGEDITLTEEYRYQPKVRNYIYSRADAVIANAEFAIQGLLRNNISASRIHKITPAVDSDRFSPRERSEKLVRRFGLADNFVLLTVARLVPRKGHDRVLHALAELSRDVKNLKYLIVGRGPEQAGLQSKANELGISNLVKFAGYVPDTELPDYYNLCDVMVMPNQEDRGDMEGFGMVFLEASATGKPVIASKSGGAEEAVLDSVTGLLIRDPKDVQELHSMLRRLHADPDLRKTMGTAGMQRARSEFSWQPRAERLREISLEIVRRRQIAGRAR